MKKIAATFFVLASMLFAQQKIIHSGNTYYLSDEIIVKVKPEFSTESKSLKEIINEKLKIKNIITAEKKFSTSSISLYKGEQNLSRIYTVTLAGSVDVVETAKKIAHLKQFEWAEPKYVRNVTADPPNDLYYGQQENLQRINALNAWNYSTGDTNVVIGIVDTGVDWNHPDLEKNIYKVNGAKIGHDFGGDSGTPDSDPSEDLSPAGYNAYHGTHVAGIADAVTNNSIGISSIGYNCKILPVKVSRNDMRDDRRLPFVVYGFEGVKYAADNGAKVINCSWGGYSYSNYEQDIIDYAISKGALVVAAAGNEASTELFYPASYRGVLSVGWLNTINEQKSPDGNYNTMVDVMSPGSNILSTWPTYANGVFFPGNGYNSNPSGSSMASPLVAGLAALVVSKFPEYTPLQVAERIRATSDYAITYAASSDDIYKYLLGRGRINAERALSETNPISVRAVDEKFIEQGNGNGVLESGESAEIQINFKNYLSSVANLKVSLECSDSAISITDSVLNIGSLDTLDEFSGNPGSFKFTVVPGGQYNHTVNLLLRFFGNNYSDYQWISVRVNPTYDNHNNNDIKLTITSKGNIGFNDFPNNLEGVGLTYKNQNNVLFEGSLMYGTSPNTLMDAARETGSQSKDFLTLSPVKITNIGSTLNQQGISVFNDNGAQGNKLGVKTTMMSYTFNEPDNKNYVILRTKFENTNQFDITNFFLGYYFDFDIPSDTSNDYSDDKVGYDFTDNFGYAYDSDGLPQQTYIASSLISDIDFGFYAINQDSTDATVSPNSSDGFLDSEKWNAISNGIKKTEAGPADISYVISGGPYNIFAGQTIDVAFVLALGLDLEEVRVAVKNAKSKWTDIKTGINENGKNFPKNYILFQNFPNPFNPETTISYQLPSPGNVLLKIYDMLGREIAILVDEYQNAGTHKTSFNTINFNLSTGVYFYQLTSGSFRQTKKLLLLK